MLSVPPEAHQHIRSMRGPCVRGGCIRSRCCSQQVFPHQAYLMATVAPSAVSTVRTAGCLDNPLTPFESPAGAQLLRFDIRKPGSSCVPRPVHTLPEGDAFVALAPMRCATSARHDGQPEHLLAAATLRCIMLLDLRRPQQALLKWPHGDLSSLTSLPWHVQS